MRFRRPWWSRGRWYWRPLPRWLPIPWNGWGCGAIALIIFLCGLAFAFAACVPSLLQR